MQHGVYVKEAATQVRKPRTTTTGIQFIVGTAPIHQLADPAAAVNVPILCESLTDATQKLGYDENFKDFTLCQSMYMDFSVLKVAPAVFVNVLDPAKHTKNVSGTVTITDGSGVLNEKNVLLSGLTIKDGDDTLVVDTDYAVSHNDNGNLLITILDGTHSTVTVTGKALDPSAVTASDIIGSIDTATGKATGLQLIRDVYPTFSFNAATILAPGYSKNPSVAAVMVALCDDINGVFRAETIIDIDSSLYKKASDAETMKASMGIKSPHAYLIWPKVKIGPNVLWGSVNAAAVAQFTDYQNAGVPNISPSNENAYIDAAVLEDGTEVRMDSEQGNILNEVGIATYIKVEKNYRIWGNYSAAYPDTLDPKDKNWCTRRFFSWHDNNFIRTYFDNVDDPTNTRLIDSIIDQENIVLNSYTASGICAASHIEMSDENTSDTLLAGKLYFKTTLTPYLPAEAIINTVAFDPDALAEALIL